MSIYSARNGAKDAPINRPQGGGDIAVGDDFPMLCETCLGQNPYVRMVKLPYGHKLCKISNAPYQGFRWKAGPQGRHKETVVCFAVAKDKNICQACLNDMQYGLPVGVRDRLLAQAQEAEGALALPQSNVGTQYHYQQLAAAQKDEAEFGGGGSSGGVDVQNLGPSQALDRFARARQAMEAKNKTAFRNLPKLCSFWLNGTCTRVTKKSCPFRPCCGTYVFPEIAGSARETCARLVARLEAEGPAAVMATLDSEAKDAIRESMKGNREEAIRRRVAGEDDLTRKYLGAMKDQKVALTPPADPSITTLWLGNVQADISEGDLREVLYPYGAVQNVHLVRPANCAFVEFASRDMAEHAAGQLYKALVVKGHAINVNWAKPRAQAITEGAAGGSSSSSSGSGSGSNGGAMPPPPGLESAPVSTYALKGLPQPVLSGEAAGAKRPASDMGEGTAEAAGGGAEAEAEAAPRAKKANKAQYPSMNPQRMGAKL
jgi:pre-mRNA-splicing factor RBM22/SLT11